MSGFTKLFSSIVTSTIWVQDNATLRVWIAMLAVADADGRVEGSAPGFASISRVSEQEMCRALKILCSPDPSSRSKEHEGRRLIKIDGGWQIVNYAKYRERGQGRDGSRAPYMREYRKKHKEAESNLVTPPECNVTHVTHDVTHVVTRNTEVEVEVDVEEEAEEKKQKSKSLKSKSCVQDTPRPLHFTPPTPDQVANYCLEHNITIDQQQFTDHYTANGWKVGRNSMKDWKAAIRNWHRNDLKRIHGGFNATVQPRQTTRFPEIVSKSIADIDAAAPVLHLPRTNGV